MGRDARDDVIELIYEIVGAPKDAPYGDLPGYVRDALRSESAAYEPPLGWKLVCEKCGIDQGDHCGWPSNCPTGQNRAMLAAAPTVEERK